MISSAGVLTLSAFYGNNIIMARPKKDDEKKKVATIRIPVTGSQKDLIVRAAQKEGLDTATWARPILLREARKHSPGE